MLVVVRWSGIGVAGNMGSYFDGGVFEGLQRGLMKIGIIADRVHLICTSDCGVRRALASASSCRSLDVRSQVGSDGVVVIEGLLGRVKSRQGVQEVYPVMTLFHVTAWWWWLVAVGVVVVLVTTWAGGYGGVSLMWF